MTKHQHRTETYLMKIPVHIEVRLVQDGSFVTEKETIIPWRLPSEDIDRLQRDTNDVVHKEFTESIATYVHERFCPLEASEIMVIVIVQGNIDTWKREPYLTN